MSEVLSGDAGNPPIDDEKLKTFRYHNEEGQPQQPLAFGSRNRLNEQSTLNREEDYKIPDDLNAMIEKMKSTHEQHRFQTSDIFALK